MSSDGSPSKPQSAAEAAALAASGAPLAPGFRFHPTDEELVSYYLKRKVLSKPFAVDAISDVDLYRMEPWDLPGKSRIQSRDMEWYFFGSLDKKYSNRSKTNRATMQGYWKTTGKDRAVRRGTRTVGMKKTLVFHVGRAPKGERTNWVMHEYRLEDDELTKAGVAQDAYVVCRIFQKNGPGPQNGAQYGAPFVEAEWEDDDKVMLGWEHGGRDILMVSGDHERSEQEDKHVDIQNENTAHQIASGDEHNIIVSSVEPNSSHVQVPRNDVVSDQNEDIYLPELDDDLDAFLINDTFSLLGSQSPLDDYLELNDLAKPLDVEEYGLHKTSAIRNEQAFMGVFDHDNNMGGLHDVEDHFNFGEGDVQVPKQDGPAFVEDNYYQDTNEIFNKIADNQADDSMLYFDDRDLYPGVQRDGFVQMADFLDPMPSAFPASDPLEDIGAYFDATDNTVQKSSVDEFLDFSTLDSANIWDEGDALQPVVQSSQLPIANCVSGASSSGLSSSSGKQIAQTSYFPKNPDLYGNAPDKSIKGRLISMLGSISSPPALAAEPKAHGLNPAAQSSSSIHITAGMIHINGLKVNGNGQPWSGEKSEDLGFLLSYDTARADISSNSSGFAHVGKMHCSSVSVAVRSGYCLSFLTVLFFAVFLKMGVVYLCQVK